MNPMRRLIHPSTLLLAAVLPIAAAAEPAPLPLDPVNRPLAFSLETIANGAMSGGPGKDGIPAIDEPRFVGAEAAAELLSPSDVVFGVARGGEARAYPQSILVWHEIVNDRIGGENVGITYCPLTGTAIGYLRGETTFGVSGDLVNNNLIMYDRATDSRWPQILGTAVEGPLEGRHLQRIRVIWTTWERWRREHPDTRVLSRDTGHMRNYGRDPYGDYTPRRGYYAGGDPMFPVLATDKRLEPKAVVFGVHSAGGAAAIGKDALRARKIMNGKAGVVPFVAVHDPRLDTAYVYRNPNGLEFEHRNGRYVRDGTAYAPEELPLERMTTFDAFWFAWAGFFPNTELYGG